MVADEWTLHQRGGLDLRFLRLPPALALTGVLLLHLESLQGAPSLLNPRATHRNAKKAAHSTAAIISATTVPERSGS